MATAGPPLIAVRRARRSDAAAIGAVHVAAWRSTYPGILPDAYLSRLSATRQAAQYEAAIEAGAVVLVAIAGDGEAGLPATRVVGFSTVGRSRSPGIAEGEIETIYVLDDWRERGIGRQLMRAAASQLAAIGCRSAFLWVLRDNPSRWFYERLGGMPAMQGATRVAGALVPQIAYAWDPIERLLTPSPTDS